MADPHPGPETSRAGRFALLAEPLFRRYWVARSSSTLGTAVSSLACVFGVLHIGGSAGSVGLVLASGAITRIALLLIGGVWADRLRRKYVMLGADVLRVVVQLTMAVLLLTDHASVWQFVVGNVVLSAATAFYQPASSALLAEVSPRERLQAASATLSIAENTITLLGPALSGVIVSLSGAGWSYLVAASAYATGAALATFLPSGKAKTAGARFVSELRSGWSEVRRHRWYWTNMLAHACWNWAISTFLVLGPVEASERFGGAKEWGLISASLSAGAILGGLIAFRVTPRRPLVTGNIALTLGALPLLALAYDQPLVVVIGAAVCAFAGLALLSALWESTVLQVVAPAALSRVRSYDYLISLSVVPLGYALAGPLADQFGNRTTLVVAATAMVVPSVIAASLPTSRAIVRDGEGVVVPA